MKGLDGKIYKVTGVSHDVIWTEEGGVLQQFDCIGGANDGNEPHPPATPVWNEIPMMYWRPNNPPLKGSDVPVPQPPQPKFPTYEETGGDVFYRANVGVPLEADMALIGQPLNEGSSVWFSRTIYDILALWQTGKPTNEQISAVVKHHRNEWRAILGLPPL